MNSEKLSEAIGGIDDDIIKEVDEMRDNKKKSRKPLWITLGSVAACAAVALTVVFTMNRGGVPTENGDESGSQSAYNSAANIETLTLAQANYPDLIEPLWEDYEDYNDYSDAYDVYRSEKAKLDVNVKATKDIPDEYYSAVLQAFLSDTDGENAVFSPVNAYMALAMAAETASGDSRQQILEALGADSIEQLRLCANGLWAGCYKNSPLNKTLLANSMWLSGMESYNTDTLQPLVDYYYASAYSGEMGSESFNKQLQSWLNENTGGLLENQISDVELDSSTVFALASTVYYNAQWVDRFYERFNTDGIFTAADETQQQAEFMNFHDDMYRYYDGDGYIATSLNIEQGDKMWLILPDEGTAPEQLVQNGVISEFLCGGKENPLDCEMYFSMPKFDITVQGDLIENFKSLGITDIFEGEKADFSALCSDSDNIFIDEVDSAVRFAVDEKGVSAASYIVMECDEAAPEPDEMPVVNFTLDRPFIFAIESNGTMLFCGIVNTLQ